MFGWSSKKDITHRFLSIEEIREDIEKYCPTLPEKFRHSEQQRVYKKELYEHIVRAAKDGHRDLRTVFCIGSSYYTQEFYDEVVSDLKAQGFVLTNETLEEDGIRNVLVTIRW